MYKDNALVRFFIIFIISYTVLVLLHMVPGARMIQTSIFVFFEEVLLNLFHPSVHAKFQLIDRQVFPNGQEYDFTMFLYDEFEWRSSINKRVLDPTVTMNQDIRSVSTGPFTLLLSLIIATPNTWKRKIIGFVIGLVILYGLQTVRYTFLIYENAPPLREANISMWVSMARNLGPLFRTAEFMMIMMLPVWALVSLDIEKIKRLYS